RATRWPRTWTTCRCPTMSSRWSSRPGWATSNPAASRCGLSRPAGFQSRIVDSESLSGGLKTAAARRPTDGSHSTSHPHAHEARSEHRVGVSLGDVLFRDARAGAPRGRDDFSHLRLVAGAEGLPLRLPHDAGLESGHGKIRRPRADL